MTDQTKTLRYVIAGDSESVELVKQVLSKAGLGDPNLWHNSFGRICDRLKLPRVSTTLEAFSDEVAVKYATEYDFRVHKGGSSCTSLVCGYVFNEQTPGGAWRSVHPDTWIFARSKQPSETTTALADKFRDELCVRHLTLVVEDDVIDVEHRCVFRIASLLSRSFQQ